MPRTNVFQIAALILLALSARAQDNIPPRITSSLNVTATEGDNFTYQILAEGSQPMTFTVGPLPPGLTNFGNTITGTVRFSGTFDISIQAQNIAGTDSRILRLTVFRGNGSNFPPQFISQPRATPNPARANVPVVFDAFATDSDGDLLTYSWDFGDGLAGIGPRPTHVYALPGFYAARVTASDGELATTATVIVVVNDFPGGGGIVNEFDIRSATIRFRFDREDRDQLVLTGIMPLSAGFRPSGTPVSVTIGGISRTFALGPGGGSGGGLNTFNLTGPTRFGTAIDLPAGFRLVIRRQDLLPALQQFGFSNTTVRRQVITFPVTIVFNETTFTEDVTVRFTAKQDKKGTAR